MWSLTMRPSREEFHALAAEHTVVPVWTELLADLETPVAAFLKLVGDGDGFLLESVEHGERWSRYSFVGHDPVAIRGRALTALVPGFDARRIRETLDGGILTGGSTRHAATVETTGLRNGGTGFAIEVVLGEIECAADLFCTCVIRDITERRQGEEWTRLANRALDCSGNGIVISDMRLPGEPVVYANPHFETITGYAPSEAIGRNLGFLQGSSAESPQTLSQRRLLVALAHSV